VVDITKDQKTATLRCDCAGQCATLVVDRDMCSDGEVSYSISMQDSRYDHRHNSVLGRIKSSFKILFGKPIYYSDIYIGDPQKFADFVNKLNEIVENKETQKGVDIDASS